MLLNRFKKVWSKADFVVGVGNQHKRLENPRERLTPDEGLKCTAFAVSPSSSAFA